MIDIIITAAPAKAPGSQPQIQSDTTATEDNGLFAPALAEAVSKTQKPAAPNKASDTTGNNPGNNRSQVYSKQSGAAEDSADSTGTPVMDSDQEITTNGTTSSLGIPIITDNFIQLLLPETLIKGDAAVDSFRFPKGDGLGSRADSSTSTSANPDTTTPPAVLRQTAAMWSGEALSLRGDLSLKEGITYRTTAGLQSVDQDQGTTSLQRNSPIPLQTQAPLPTQAFPTTTAPLNMTESQATAIPSLASPIHSRIDTSSAAIIFKDMDSFSEKSPLEQLPNNKDSLLLISGNQKYSQTLSQTLPQAFSDNSISYLHYNNSTLSTESPLAPLSTEGIIANLTTLAIEPPKLNEGLRGKISIRQDIMEQYLGAKIQKTDLTNDQQNGARQFENQEKAAAQSQLLSPIPSNDVTSENSFTNSTSHLFADKTTQAIVDTTRPSSIPLSVPVPEDDIIQQVIQKFRINSQLQNSKLVMKLHPAELGELKIDIQLKGGSLNASIITQSQQVREILEKNMPKLRDLMEQHGIVVGNISVKIETETIADYNLFQQQFSREGNTTDSKKSAKTATSFELSLEKSVNDELTPETGVNVTV